MKITKQNIFLYGGSALIISVALYIAINSIRKKKLIKQLNEILDKGTQATGTSADIATDDAFDPNFYKNYQKKNNKMTLVSSEVANKMAKTIYDSIGNFYDDEPAIVSQIKTIGTKTKLSWVSDKFTTKYGKNLGSFIVEHVDRGDNLQQIQNIIKTMPEN